MSQAVSIAPERGKPNLEHVARAAPGVEYGAAATVAVSVDQLINRCIEPSSRQGRNDQSTFPIAIARSRQMLKRATAANSEMRADRRNAVGARNVDLGEMAAIGVARPGLDLGGLARQRIGHVERARFRIGDTVAARAQPRYR
jgi:hypothetical protein